MNLFNKKKGNRGFTLVELLAAIVILGILSTMAIAGVSNLIKKAKSSAEDANAKTIQMAAESYLQANKDTAPRSIGECVTVSASDLKNKKFLTDEITNSNNESCMKNSYVKIFKSSNGEYIYTPYIYCGADKASTDSKDKMVPVGEIKFSKSTDVNKASFTLNLYGDQNKTKGQYTPTTEIDGYSWSLSVMYEGENSYTEIYNTGTLSANKAKTLEISEKLSDYVDISSTTRVKVDYTIINVACETYTSEMVSDGGASSTTQFEDTVPPICGAVSGDASSEKDWVSNSSSSKTRLVSVACSDGDGSGCKRKTFSRSWPDKTNPLGVEKAYIDIYDNRDKKFDGNSETGNKTQCLVNVNVDLQTPSASLIATKTATDNNNVLSSGKPLKIEASSDPVASNVIYVSDYKGTTSDWMNKNDFSEGIYFKVDLKDNLHLDHYTWETNKGYQTSVNENEISVTNPDGVESTLIPQEEQYGKDDYHGSTHYSIIVKLGVEGKRYGVLTVYDQAGNAIKYEIYANIDRTAPKAPTFGGTLVDKDNSKYDVYSYESSYDSVWTNSRVKITSTGTGKDEIWDTIQNKNVTNMSGHKQYYYYLYNVTDGEKKINDREKINDGGNFTIVNDGVYKVRFEDCDKAGNCSFSNWKYVKIDRTPPTCKATLSNTKKNNTSKTYTPGSWVNGTVTISQTCKDDDKASGCTKKTPISSTYGSNGSNFTNVNKNVGAAEDGSGGVFYDNAGNSVVCPTYKVQIDNDDPKCNVTSSHTGWTRGPITITASCSDTGGSNCKDNNHTYSFSCNDGEVCIRYDLGAGVNGGEDIMYDNAGNFVKCAANQTGQIDRQAPNDTHQSFNSSTRTVTASAKDCSVEGVYCAGNASISYAFTTGGQPAANDSIWGTSATGALSCNATTYVYVKFYDSLGNVKIKKAGEYTSDCCSESNPYGCPWVTACRKGQTNTYLTGAFNSGTSRLYRGVVWHLTPGQGEDGSGEDYLYIIRYEGKQAVVYVRRAREIRKIYKNCINYISPNAVCAYSQCPG